MLYPARVQITWWLVVCALLVFCMIILGGAVRVTGSGLSMVDWQPLLGVLPPLGEAAWLEALSDYQRSPEGQQVNARISLGEFQFIYYMEYFHRILGRLIGLVFFVPFMFFLSRGGMSRALKSRLWLLLFLGTMQGLMGWYMVKSGLVDNPHVSQYRLTAHLLLAVVILVGMIRLIVGLWHGIDDNEARTRVGGFLPLTTLALLSVLLMVASGGFMAGTQAGHIFNTWPRMGDAWVPQMLAAMQPWWRNLFENTITIQFIHRWLAILVAVIVVFAAVSVLRREDRGMARLFASLAILVVLVQVLLGIATLVSGVPGILAVSHQGTGMLLTLCVTVVWSSQLTSLRGDHRQLNGG